MAKRKRSRRRHNPGALATFGWAAGTAAVASLATYYVLREVYAGQIVQQCEIFRVVRQQQGMQAGIAPTGMPVVTVSKDQARAWF